MKIILNGKHKEIGEAATIASLIQELQLNEQRVVVELNEEVVSKDTFSQVSLKPEDRLEILQFVGGG